jgi:hypothetical protein
MHMRLLSALEGLSLDPEHWISLLSIFPPRNFDYLEMPEVIDLGELIERYIECTSPPEPTKTALRAILKFNP